MTTNVVIILAVLLLLIILRPKAPRSFEVHFMAQRATFTWTKSTSPSVKKQLISVNGTVTELTPDIVTFSQDFPDATAVHAELWVSDGVLESPHAVLDATSPTTPVPPAAPTDFKVTFAQV